MTESCDEQRAFEERLRLQIEAYHESALVYAAVKLGLPDRMATRAWTSEQLAAELGLSAPHLLRFLRGLCTLGICEELPDGSFTLAPGGRSLSSSSPSRLAKKVQIVVEQYWRPWMELLLTLKTGGPAFDNVFDMSVTEWRREHADQGAMFESYLTAETFDQAGSIIEALDPAAEAARVADIGGGCGALLAPLLIAYPHLTGALFDKPHMIEMAKPFLQVFGQFRLPERIELVAGDFFADIPVRADIYLLKGVLQQWDDASARTILANCRKAMPEDARLAIIERVLPERAMADPAAVMLDLHMMTITGGHVRSLAQFEALLSQAGLTIAKVMPTRSGLSIVEAIPGR
ncbi:MAG TPA: methyltransferase [Methyloceanibacter sp.]|nr:methyltransferase [Methyloceanibacter sp.]